MSDEFPWKLVVIIFGICVVARVAKASNFGPGSRGDMM